MKLQFKQATTGTFRRKGFIDIYGIFVTFQMIEVSDEDKDKLDKLIGKEERLDIDTTVSEGKIYVARQHPMLKNFELVIFLTTVFGFMDSFDQLGINVSIAKSRLRSCLDYKPETEIPIILKEE